MKCANCQRENDPTYRFCILCGTPLLTSELQEHSGVLECPLGDDTGLEKAGSSQKNVPKHQKEVETDYAGFRRRFVAWIIDAVILGALFWIIVWPWYVITNPTDGQAVFLVYFVWLIASSIYVLGFWTWRGQTPGKMVMRIKIMRSDGRPFGISKVILRFIGYIAPAIIMLILFIFVATVFRGIPGLKELRGPSVLVVPYLASILVILLPYWLTIALDSKKQGFHDKIAKTYVIKTQRATVLESPENKTVASDS
ncbi:RDD family protein [Chloroflexota bacterium]